MIELLLKELALLGATHKHILITTSQLGLRLGISQQSASRWITYVESLNLVKKENVGRNIRVKLTREGMNILRHEFFEYTLIFGAPKLLHFEGKVVSGLGEGKYYISKRQYKRQIIEKLFFDPFPGTLNVKLYPEYVEKLAELKEAEPIILDGFEEGGHTYGRVFAYFATISKHPGALILPELSHYREVVELISHIPLREVCKLIDGDEVEIAVFL